MWTGDPGDFCRRKSAHHRLVVVVLLGGGVRWTTGWTTIMSTAMRSTLQTVPESLEVTRGGGGADTATGQTTLTTTTAATTKTPVKLGTTETTKTSSRTSYGYHTPSATNKVSVFSFWYLPSYSYCCVLNGEGKNSCYQRMVMGGVWRHDSHL